MKRLIALAVYTIVIVGGSYFFQDAYVLSTVLYIGIVVIAIGIIGLLNPGVATMMSGKGYFGKGDLNYIKANEEMNAKLQSHHTKLKDIDFISILTYLYLFVPFFIAIMLFV